MRELFLGKPWHWLLIVVAAVLCWLAGGAKMHVIQFNTFLIALIVGAAVLVALVLRSTGPGERVTRDPLPDPAVVDAADEDAPRDPEAGA